MRYLPPMILTEALYAPIEETINQIFKRTLFDPLRAALAEAGIEIMNARNLSLERGLVQGTIYYEDGRIYGQFNASISKELKGMGATYDKRTGSWQLPEGAALPARLQLAVAQADAKVQKAVDAVVRALDSVNLQDTRTPEELKEQYGTAAWRMNEQFLETTKAIAIAPELTEEARDIIAREWGTNLDLFIKGWTEDAILELREKVTSNTMRGQRSANLVKMIQDTYGASKAKATFLARQETSLLMSKMREERYKDIGVEKYVWTGVNDSREREDHKVLNGTVQRFSQPPITNRETGARNNPGEDFGCRCIAVPILPGEANA